MVKINMEMPNVCAECRFMDGNCGDYPWCHVLRKYFKYKYDIHKNRFPGCPLIPVKTPQRPEKLLPCKCGCKRREHWYSSAEDCRNILKCYKCGFEVGGKNEIDVHKKWNEAIRNRLSD